MSVLLCHPPTKPGLQKCTRMSLVGAFLNATNYKCMWQWFSKAVLSVSCFFLKSTGGIVLSDRNWKTGRMTACTMCEFENTSSVVETLALSPPQLTTLWKYIVLFLAAGFRCFSEEYESLPLFWTNCQNLSVCRVSDCIPSSGCCSPLAKPFPLFLPRMVLLAT